MSTLLQPFLSVFPGSCTYPAALRAKADIHLVRPFCSALNTEVHNICFMPQMAAHLENPLSLGAMPV